MNTQNNHALVAAKPFALICSFQIPTTELNPDFVPSVSVVIGHYDSQEQTKHERQAIQHAAAKIREGALVMQGLDNQRNLAAFLARQQRIKARQSQAQTAKECRTTAAALSADIGRSIAEANHV